MQARMASALFALFALLSSPGPVAAQSSTRHPQAPQASPEKTAAAAKVSELLKNHESKNVQHPINQAEQPTNLLPPPEINVLQPGILSQAGARSCAHIILFQAPNMDSEMIVEAPLGTGGNMPTVEALPPCPQDFRFAMGPQQFPGIKLFPRRGPFLQQPFSQFRPLQPKKNEAPATKP